MLTTYPSVEAEIRQFVSIEGNTLGGLLEGCRQRIELLYRRISPLCLR